jgi:hypothetical protein
MDFQGKNPLRIQRNGCAGSNFVAHPAQWIFSLIFACAASATVALAEIRLRRQRSRFPGCSADLQAPQRAGQLPDFSGTGAKLLACRIWNVILSI